jgi:hypothetical protein
MASINFDDYEKNQQDQSPGEVITKRISMGCLETKDTQYYIEEENILFDFLELDFGEKQGIGVEVWMSYLGEDFKMKIDMMSKEDYTEITKDKSSFGNLIGGYLEDFKECLECKSGFLENLCDLEHGEEDKDD